MDLSIIIPVGPSDTNFSLLSDLKIKFKNSEVIVVSSDQNKEIYNYQKKIDKLITINNSTRAKAQNVGADKSNYKKLWFLHLDSDLSNISIEDLENIQLFKINTFKLRFNNNRFDLNSFGANLRTYLFGLPFGDQSFIIEKKLFNLIGGFAENLEQGEDHELIWRSKKIGIKINLINKYIITSGDKYENHQISQTFLTFKNTILQIMRFKKSRVSCVICHFTKNPSSKDSKKRLRKNLPDDFVNEINENLIEILKDNINEIKKDTHIHQIIVSEKNHKDYFLKFSKNTNGLYLTSHSELGKSMKEVIEFNFMYFKKVVLVGSDIPLLLAKDILKATKINSSKNIFYPTFDGGFCLLSTTDKNISNIIDTVKYGTNTALSDLTKKTSEQLIHNKFYQDIDVKEDLIKIFNFLKKNNTNLNTNQKRLLTLLHSNHEKIIK